MRGGAISAAALRAQSPHSPATKHQQARHCTETEYRRFIEGLSITMAFRRQRMNFRRRFVDCWPLLTDWLAEPLVDRVGRLRGENRSTLTSRVSYQGRSYLVYLGLRGHGRLDYPWLLGLGHLCVFDVASALGIDLGVDELTDEAVRLGFDQQSAQQAIRWALGRLALGRGDADPRSVRAEHIDELLVAVRRFGERPDLPMFYGSPERYRNGVGKMWISHLHQLQVVLYHRGQIDSQPRKLMPNYAKRRASPTKMQAIVDRWLAARRLSDRPQTVQKLALSLRRFLEWSVANEPTVTSFAEVTRGHLLRNMASLAEDPVERLGRPLSVLSRAGRISAPSMFFRDTAAWGWDDVPGRPLLGPGDIPKRPASVPRYIPSDELALLMGAVTSLQCPYQRAALLTARWSGARQGEIRRLAVDCLDNYSDGTPRLRLPAGKTYRERVIPVHQEAAAALRTVISLRLAGAERPFNDELTGKPTRYLFMSHGKLLSSFYLFETPLQKACRSVGLVDVNGRGTISAHRFRHTVGTQLAENGARLHTIMSVLSHRSASMSLVYAQISDKEIVREYQEVLGPAANIAGPGVQAIRTGALTTEAVDWLKANFFKTELELGHCLRLPSEGPCDECNCYLRCAKLG